MDAARPTYSLCAVAAFLVAGWSAVLHKTLLFLGGTRYVLPVIDGEEVRPFERHNDLVGLSFFKFETMEEMDEVMWNVSSNAEVLLDGGE